MGTTKTMIVFEITTEPSLLLRIEVDRVRLIRWVRRWRRLIEMIWVGVSRWIGMIGMIGMMMERSRFWRRVDRWSRFGRLEWWHLEGGEGIAVLNSWNPIKFRSVWNWVDINKSTVFLMITEYSRNCLNPYHSVEQFFHGFRQFVSPVHRFGENCP